MIREYAVDPDAIYRSLDSLQRFLTDFNAENGRVVSAVPRHWFEAQNAAIRSFVMGPVARSNALGKLKKIRDVSLVVGHIIPSAMENWIEQAIHVKNNADINAIISTSVCVDNDIFDYRDLLGRSPDNWEIDNTQSIERTAINMADAICLSLKIATTVFYIDPYFNPGENRYVAPLLAFIQKMQLGRARVLTIHTTTNTCQRHDFIRDLEQIIKPDLPSGFTVKLFIWRPAQMHDRYILTKNVGYSFGHGLDQRTYINALNVNINRLSENARKREFRFFSVKDDLNDNVISVTGE